jgi:ElaB/YqjD/DUF883 family membrane-anchored ribosome-binding protein
MTKHKTTDQVAGKAHQAVDGAAEAVGKAEEYTRDYLSHADERTREAAAHGRQQLEGVLARLNGYTREKPLMSFGIAFVAGFLCSSLTRRR